jgi:peptide/nickel transport system substrate-binding protein
VKSLGKFKLKVSQIWGGVATGLLLIGVACGTPATATPAATEAPQPPPAQPAVPPALVATATATPVPAPVAAPAVSPGKVTWMVGNFGNERFDYTLSAGGGGDHHRLVQAFFISSDVKDGSRVDIPGIATKWEISGDGLTWILTVRKGVKFHDGTEVRVEDALWTLQHSIGPQAKDYATFGGAAQIVDSIDRIERMGPDRIGITSKSPMPDLAGIMAEASGMRWGVVMPKRATFGDGPEAKDYDDNPIGAGIMRLVKHVPADLMTFERFADYYHQPKNGFPTDKRVNFTLLDLRQIPEEATRVAALRAGDADIAPVSLGARKQVEAGGGRLVFGQEGVALMARTHGCWKPEFPCHDKRVRQALAYAIDKELMRDRLYGPEVMEVKGWGAVTPSAIGYSPELDPFPFDPAKARQLLAEAGYPGGKGFAKLVINAYVTTSLPLMVESAQLVAENWRRELGLEVEVKVSDETALKEEIRATENVFGQVVWRDDEARLDASGNLRSQYGTPGRRDGPHNDPELFALVGKALAAFDPVEQEKVLNSTYRRMRDEAYWISVGYVNIPWGVGPRIGTWEPLPLANYISALHTITLVE